MQDKILESKSGNKKQKEYRTDKINCKMAKSDPQSEQYKAQNLVAKKAVIPARSESFFT